MAKECPIPNAQWVAASVIVQQPGHWSLVIGHSLNIGRWPLGIEHWAHLTFLQAAESHLDARSAACSGPSPSPRPSPSGRGRNAFRFRPAGTPEHCERWLTFSLPMNLPGRSEPWVGGARLLPSRRDVPCSDVLVHRDTPPARREPRPTSASPVQGLKSRNLGPWIFSQRERAGVRENGGDDFSPPVRIGAESTCKQLSCTLENRPTGFLLR